MKVRQRASFVVLCLGVAMALPLAPHAQQNRSSEDIGNPLTGPPVRGAPFSAEATTTVQQTLRDGTRIDRAATARYYRDGAGRVRVEQPTIRSKSPNRAARNQIRITIDSGAGGDVVSVLDPAARMAGIGSRGLSGLAVGGGSTFALPLQDSQFLTFSRPGSARAQYLWDKLGPVDVKEESLGDRRSAGVDTIGRRVTVTIPIGRVRNDQPIEVLDERWESPELKIVIYSRAVDPRAGVIEYRVTNIQRTEPDPDLFVIPQDYTVVSTNVVDIKLVYADNVPPKLATDRGKW